MTSGVTIGPSTSNFERSVIATLQRIEMQVNAIKMELDSIKREVHAIKRKTNA